MDTKIIQGVISKTLEEMSDATPQCEIFAHLFAANLIRLAVKQDDAPTGGYTPKHSPKNGSDSSTDHRSKSKTYTCIDCKKPFEARGYIAKRCSDCKKIYAAAYARNLYLKHKKKQLEQRASEDNAQATDQAPSDEKGTAVVPQTGDNLLG